MVQQAEQPGTACPYILPSAGAGSRRGESNSGGACDAWHARRATRPDPRLLGVFVLVRFVLVQILVLQIFLIQIVLFFFIARRSEGFV